MAALDPSERRVIPNPHSPIPGRSVPGLYVHVPFCSSICNYCNFNRGLFDETLKTRFVEALLQEMQEAARGIREKAPGGVFARSTPKTPPGAFFDTLYFGGGTPSLLTPTEIRSIIDAGCDSLGLTADAEITLEANPETVTAFTLEQFRTAGVNRLSFGVQSFRDEELKRLGRLHTAERAMQAVELARAAGFDNVSIDLMMWLPGQDVAQWLTSVDAAIRVNADHLSLYILEVYPHLPLKQDIDRYGWTQVPDDAAADMYESAMARLDAAGYEQYEISNVSRAGRESRHNVKYWTDGDWLGFGPGAHSTWDGTRWRNLASTEEYIDRIARGESAVVDRRTLTDEERLGDALFTGLRLSCGVDVDLLSMRYGVDIWRRFGDRLAPFLEAGILLRQDARLRLTRPGMLLANEVMSVFV
ncbi:MAG TPA: radical SAM family heme chaperone HemW [Vicinamibacterales bacterium]